MKKDYRVYTIMFLVFYFPLGIPYMWFTKTFAVKTRIIITLSFSIACIIGLLALIIWTSGPNYIH